MKGFLKYFLSVALAVLILITSMGIYGFLSNAFKETEAQYNASSKKVELLELKKNNFQDRIDQYQVQVDQFNDQVSTLTANRSSINTAIQTSSNYYEYIDPETGDKVRRPMRSSDRATLIQQLESIDNQVSTLQERITVQYDSIESKSESILQLENEILQTTQENEAGAELGPLIYISELTGYKISSVVNVFMLILIIVFDPLAVALVFAASYAFSYTVEVDNPKEENEDDPIYPDNENGEEVYERIPDEKYEDFFKSAREYYKNTILPNYLNHPEGRSLARGKKKVKFEKKGKQSESESKDFVEEEKKVVEKPNKIKAKKKQN